MNDEQKLAVLEATDAEINAAHGRVVGLGKEMEAHLLAVSNSAARCGLLLIERRKSVKHGEWQSMFRTAKGKGSSQSTFHFDYSLGCKYIRLAVAHPSEFLSWEEAFPYIKDLAIMQGMLPDPDGKGHGPQNVSGRGLMDSVIDFTGRLTAAWTKYDGPAFLANISPEERATVIARIAPAKQQMDEIWSALNHPENQAKQV